MNETQLQQIHASVAGFLSANPGFRIVARNAIESMVETIRGHVPAVDNAELHVAAAMCALGPAKPPPPLTAFADFAAVVEREAPGRLDRILEVAIAYGCGKWRRIDPQRGRWFDEWGNAVVALARAAEPAVREVVGWLSQRLPGLPSVEHWSSDDGRDLIKRDAAMLAVHLVRALEPLHAPSEGEHVDIACTPDGTSIAGSAGAISKFLAPGNKAVFSNDAVGVELRGINRQVDLPPATVFAVLAVDERTRIFLPRPLADLSLKIEQHAALSPAAALALWTCSCGNRNCADRHRLEAWRPAVVDLWSFVASAVKGPERTIKAGALIAGMYFPFLGHHGIDDCGRLRLVPVEYKFCATPACREVARKYQGERCPVCQVRFDPKTMCRRGVQRVVLVRSVALYERAERFACADHDNLYEGPSCPICGGVARVRRPTWVWIRTGNREDSLDDDPSLVAQLSTGDDDPDGGEDKEHEFI